MFNNEMEDLDKQLKEILEKKDIAAKKITDLRGQFDIIASTIQKTISEMNELKHAENRVLQKIHNLETSNINNQISNSLSNSILNKIKIGLHFLKSKKTEQPIQALEYKEIKKEIAETPEDVKAKTIEAINSDKQEIAKSIEVKTQDETNNKKTQKTTSAKKTVGASKTATPKNTQKKETIKIAPTKTKAVAKSKIETKKSEIATTTIEIKSIEKSEELELPTTKQEGLMLWIKHEGVDYKEDKINELFTQYSNFLESKFGDKINKETLYAQKGPSFKLALRKMLSTENSK